jgi:hypothetical protein
MTEIISGIAYAVKTTSSLTTAIPSRNIGGLCARPFANASHASAQGPHRELAARFGSC